jgi:AcrR family transcriptional regulator
MMENETSPSRKPGRQIRQKRGLKTYDALVAAGFELLERKDFDDITVAELARHAGYSVGAFYARFHSKDEYLDALLARHFEHRLLARGRMIEKSTRESLPRDVVKELVTYYWSRRQFWRAALLRAMRDQVFWKPLRDHGNVAANTVVAEVAKKAGRELTKTEKTNVRFAFECVLGTINNSIVNRPGPILYLGQVRFIDNLTRAFRLVSDYGAIVGDSDEASAPSSALKSASR